MMPTTLSFAFLVYCFLHAAIGSQNAWPCSADDRSIYLHIRQANAKIRNCYERSLRRDHSIEGQVMVTFRINPAGESLDVVVDGDINDSKFVTCIAAVHKAIAFPRAADDVHVHVRYPYRFRPLL